MELEALWSTGFALGLLRDAAIAKSIVNKRTVKGEAQQVI